MSPEFKGAIRDALIPPLLKQLATKRPPGVPRTEFFLHAEAFAAMASVDIVPLEGAVTTVVKLMRDPAQRAAAVTALGKLVEQAAYLVRRLMYKKKSISLRPLRIMASALSKPCPLCPPCMQIQDPTKVSPAALAALHDAVNGISEPDYQYDIDYIKQSMEWA